jgi:hypothetical protein
LDETKPREVQERRVHVALRALVDDMLTQIRDAVRHDGWTAEERRRAEADLARIMDRVRQEALTRGGG